MEPINVSLDVSLVYVCVGPRTPQPGNAPFFGMAVVTCRNYVAGGTCRNGSWHTP
jgi:hypothetical protein